MPEKVSIWAEGCPSSIGHYSQAIKMNEFIFISAQLPLNPSTGLIVSTDFKEQVIQIFKNLTALVTATGGQLSHILKITIYTTDLSKMNIVDEVSKTYFYFLPPARSVIEVNSLPMSAYLQADAVAFIPHIDVKGGMLL